MALGIYLLLIIFPFFRAILKEFLGNVKNI